MLNVVEAELLQKLLQGFWLVDYTHFEPGMCCNGGHYAINYRVRLTSEGYTLESLSSYEDAEWEYIGGNKSLLHFVKYVATHWFEKKCVYLSDTFTWNFM